MRSAMILHVIEALGRGGAERRLVLDVSHLNREPFQHVVCHLYPQGDLKEELASFGIPTFWLGMRRLSEWPRGALRLIQMIKKSRVDLIHTQLFGADVIGRIVGRLFNIPVVSTIQSSVYEPGIPYFRSPARRWVDGWTGKLCNSKFIAVSCFVKQSIQRRLKYRDEDIVVIYNGLDPAKFSPDGDRIRLRRSFGWNGEDTLLICVGKLNPPKGQHWLIQALQDVVRRYPRVKLLVVGSGPSQEEWVALSCRLGLKDKVFFMGERRDVRDLLDMSDIFVFPSISEGMPLALLEAMAMKKPCIASDIPPIREVIEDRKTGLLVTPRSTEAIVVAIGQILSHPERAKALASRGRDVVIEKFNAQKNAHLLEELYRELLEA